ncbi:hypothetical protein LXL04_011232 [Taraxacum kok-saghyz]
MSKVKSEEAAPLFFVFFTGTFNSSPRDISIRDRCEAERERRVGGGSTAGRNRRERRRSHQWSRHCDRRGSQEPPRTGLRSAITVVLEVGLVRWGTLWVDSPRSYDIV